jgi:DNA-binding transcriptional regulator YdaS (Cro superfamily)
METKRAALERAISVLGNMSSMARLMGLNSHQVIGGWKTKASGVPIRHCLTIERLTREAASASGDSSLVVACEELRPDVEWSVLRSSETI